MAKYNVVQKSKRESSHDRKRRAHGDPNSGKLKHHNAPIAISGKRKRKLLRRLNRVGSIPFRLPSYWFPWRLSDACLVQDQKEAAMVKALENNMGDVDMVSAEGTALGLLDCFEPNGGD